MDSSQSGGPSSSATKKVLRSTGKSQTENARTQSGKKGKPKASNSGKKPVKPKKRDGGDEPSKDEPLTHYHMWAHFDKLLRKASDEEMIIITARFNAVINEVLKNKEKSNQQ